MISRYTPRSICSPEHEWSDEILLTSKDGAPLNLESLTELHGIQIISRRQVAGQIEEMVNFCHAAHESRLSSHVESLMYCSNSDCCFFEFTNDFDEFSDSAKELRRIARKYIGQFDWFGEIDHGEPPGNWF